MKIWAQYFLSVYCSNEISFTPEILSVSYYSLCSDFIVMILIFCLNTNLPVCFNKHFESPKKLLINGTRLDCHINIAILTRWTNSHKHSFQKKNPCDMVFQFINEDVACQHNCDCVFSFLDDVLLVSNQTSIYLRAPPPPNTVPAISSLFVH